MRDQDLDQAREGIGGTPTSPAPPDIVHHCPGRHEPPAEAALLLKTADIAELIESGRLRFEGDGEKIGELLGLLDEPDPGFPIVTPRA